MFLLKRHWFSNSHWYLIVRTCCFFYISVRFCWVWTFLMSVSTSHHSAQPTTVVIMHSGLWLYSFAMCYKSPPTQTRASARGLRGSGCVRGTFCICSHDDEPPHEENAWPLWQGALSSILLFLAHRGAESELGAGEGRSEHGLKGKTKRGNCTDIKRSRRAEAITWHNLINHLTMRGRALF